MEDMKSPYKVEWLDKNGEIQTVTVAGCTTLVQARRLSNWLEAQDKYLEGDPNDANSI